MSKIGLAICGSSGIDYVAQNHNMKVFRSIISIDGKDYKDYEDINSEQLYTLMKNAEKISTSQTATGELIQIVKDFRNQGYTDLIMITISSGLSGTYQNVCLSSREIEGINVHVIDSLSVGYCEANLGLVAKEMIEKNYDIKTIVETLEYLANHSYISFLVDDLHYLKLNGRLSNAQAFFGNMLKIRPILWFDKEGRVVVKEKVRKKSKAMERLIDVFLENVPDTPVKVFFNYTNGIEDVLELQEILKSKSDRFDDITICPLSPVIGVHGGPGTFGIGFTPKIDI